MKLIGIGLLLAGAIEFVIVPAVAGACHTPSGCAANAFGVRFLHAIAIGAMMGGLVNLPAIRKWWLSM